MIRFMVIVPASAGSESGALPDEGTLDRMGAFNEELARAGVMISGEGLHPTSRGVRLRFRDGETTVTRGPFGRTEGTIAGFWLIQAQSEEEAIAWMKRAPFGGGFEIELRPIFELEDFGPAATPEIREREERLRRGVGARRG